MKLPTKPSTPPMTSAQAQFYWLGRAGMVADIVEFIAKGGMRHGTSSLATFLMSKAEEAQKKAGESALQGCEPS